MTKLASALPKGSTNGLEAIAAQLVEQPEAVHVVVALVDCSRITVNTDEGTSEPTARITAIEPLTGNAADTVGTMLAAAYSRRTGRAHLPFDEETGEVLDD